MSQVCGDRQLFPLAVDTQVWGGHDLTAQLLQPPDFSHPQFVLYLTLTFPWYPVTLALLNVWLFLLQCLAVAWPGLCSLLTSLVGSWPRPHLCSTDALPARDTLSSLHSPLIFHLTLWLVSQLGIFLSFPLQAASSVFF